MSFTPNFSTTQTSGNPGVINFSDISSGSDSLIVSRRIYLRKADGTFLVPSGTTTDYISWIYANSTISVNALTEDMALSITVEWLYNDSSIQYSKIELSGFTQYNESFDYLLTQMLTANPLLINDNDFFSKKSLLRTFIDSGNNALLEASDQFAAQSCYKDATDLRLDSKYIFNVNS